jgi:hypothetical protein
MIGLAQDGEDAPDKRGNPVRVQIGRDAHPFAVVVTCC